MKLTRLTKLAMAAGLTVSVSLTACGSDDGGSGDGDNTSGDGDSTAGDGDSTAGDGDSTAGGGATSMPGDGDGDATGICDPGETRCTGENVVETCLGDGDAWYPSNCELGCSDGACVEPPTICSPGETMCTDASTRVTCASDGGGYEEVTCPDSAPCVDGVCAGVVCNAGETRCKAELTAGQNWFEGFNPSALNVVETCVDGTAWVESPCDTGTVCTYDRVAPYDPAAILVEVEQYFNFPFNAEPKAPEILPGAVAACRETECMDNFVIDDGPRGELDSFTCGDPNDASVDSSTSFSQCSHVAPFGVPKWITQECAVGTCSGDSNSPCETDCVPGATRCQGDRELQTCNQQGEWEDSVTCMDGNALGACVQEPFLQPDGRTSAMCVDAACQSVLEGSWYEGFSLDEFGVCVNTAEIALCNEAGELQPASSCTVGTCVDWYEGLDGNRAGECQTDCEPGDERCNGDGIQVCDASGNWGTTTECAGDASCMGDGADGVLCGECVEGETDCSGDQIAVCGADNTWAAPADCDFGRCAYTYTGSRWVDACRGDCTPGEVLCNSASSSQTCGADGLWDDAVTCAGETKCLLNNNYDALGCVECVSATSGGNNTYNQNDSTCDAGELAVCGSDNMWQTPVACTGEDVCISTGIANLGTTSESHTAECGPAIAIELTR